MDSELSALEERIDQFLTINQNLRSENQDLRTRLAALEAEKKLMRTKMTTAAERLEVLLDQVPKS